MGVGGGCLPFHFSLLACPLSPQPPSPVGKGEILTLFRRGLRPRHPGNRVGSGTGFYFGSRSLFAFRRKGCPQRQESSTNVGFSGAARVQPRGCKGRSPLHEITLVSPFPVGEERSTSAGRGDILPLRGRGAKNFAFAKPGLAPGGTGRSIRVLQTRQKRLSRFCNTRHPSRHARAQAKAGTGRERRLPSIIIRSRKVLGGVGDSFKSPPAHPRIPVSLSPVRRGDGGRGCRSRRSGRQRGGGRRRRRPRGQRRGGRGTGRSRPCRRG